MNKLIKNNKNLIYILPTIIFIIVGLYLRLKGLGKFPLALDEFYVIRSVQNILETGLPEFNYGGFYSRGLIFQYLITFLMWSGVEAEFAGRFISVVAYIVGLPALFLIVKKFSSKTLPYIVVILFSISIWEIEFSRFARMYMIFQTFFLWYLVYFFGYIFDKKEKHFWWLILISFSSIFIYEASIFLAILNFLIIIWDREKQSFNFKLLYRFRDKGIRIKFVFASIVFVLTYLFLSYNFRTLNVNNFLPPELLSYFSNLPKEPTLNIPVIILFLKPTSYFWFILHLIPIGAIILYFSKIFNNTQLELESKISYSILAILLLLNFLGLFLLFTLVALTLRFIKFSDFSTRDFRYIISLFALLLLYISIYALLNSNWHSELLKDGTYSSIASLKYFLKYSFNYPNIYETFVLFRDAIPIYTYMTYAIIFSGIIIILTNNSNKYSEIRILIAIVIFVFVLVTFINLKHFATRYFFFLFPIYLTLSLLLLEISIKRLFSSFKIQQLFLFGYLIIFLFIAEDFNLNHLLNIDTEEINYRKTMSYSEKRHYYPRWDSRTVSELVNNNSSDDDLIITNEKTSSYYLNRLNYIYADYTGGEFRIQSVNNGKNERWTNALLIYDYNDFMKKLLPSENQKWLIINKMWGMKRLEKLGFFENINQYLFHESSDGLTNLYKIPAVPKF